MLAEHANSTYAPACLGGIRLDIRCLDMTEA